MQTAAEVSARLIEAAQKLRDKIKPLRFSPPVVYTYNPLDYAWEAHQMYLTRFGGCTKKVLFIGMNPGPFGMVQTGVPFGEIAAVRDWMRISCPVGKPPREHPKRPVAGFDCPKSEVSGRRLWGLFARRYPDPSAFFATQFVVNYCPLAFVEETGRNRTPQNLPAHELRPLEEACLEHLRTVVQILQPEWLIGVGRFAEERAQRVVADSESPFRVECIPHPSPANPAANRNWDQVVERQLIKLGIWK